MIANTYTPPASVEIYIADVLRDAGVDTTLAQGFGYHALSPILQLWRLFRNIAYVFFTIVIIAVGFIILFRQKVGGQAVVTVQQALPRVIVALILVTFSYAIAGLVVDLMYLVMYAFASMLTGIDAEERTLLIQGGFEYLFVRMNTGSFSETSGVVNNFVGALLRDVPLGGVLTWLGGTFMSLIVALAILFASLYVLFILLTSYVVFIFNVIFGPLILMFGAIPGINTFKKWFMSLVANLAPFPIVMVLISVQGVLSATLTSPSGTGSAPGQINAQGVVFVPPYIVGDGGAIDGQTVASVITLGIMLTMPTILKKAKAAIAGGGGGYFGDIGMAAADKMNDYARRPARFAGRVAKGAAIGGLALGGRAAGRGIIGSRQASNKLKEQGTALEAARAAGDTEAEDRLLAQQAGQIELHGSATQRAAASGHIRTLNKARAAYQAQIASGGSVADARADYDAAISTETGMSAADFRLAMDTNATDSRKLVHKGTAQRRRAFLDKHGIVGGIKKSAAAGESGAINKVAWALSPGVRKDQRIALNDYLDKVAYMRREQGRLAAIAPADLSEGEKENQRRINDWLTRFSDSYSGDTRAASKAWYQARLRGEDEMPGFSS